MSDGMKNTLWQQFGAAIDMLENAISACPSHVWGNKFEFTEFWYIAYHTLFWLDFYLSESEESFTPPPPFGLEELDPAGLFPPCVYTKDELLAYLAHDRQKCRDKIGALTDMTACALKSPFGAQNFTTVEALLYNMRHVQHHAAQLNLLLRQQANDAPRWVRRAKMPLSE
jgi:hypothetical protein